MAEVLVQFQEPLSARGKDYMPRVFLQHLTRGELVERSLLAVRHAAQLVR